MAHFCWLLPQRVVKTACLWSALVQHRAVQKAEAHRNISSWAKKNIPLHWKCKYVITIWLTSIQYKHATVYVSYREKLLTPFSRFMRTFRCHVRSQWICKEMATVTSQIVVKVSKDTELVTMNSTSFGTPHTIIAHPCTATGAQKYHTMTMEKCIITR